MKTRKTPENSTAMQSHMFSQFWFLVVSVSAFLIYVAWDQQLISSVIKLDKSYMASLIALLALCATCHVAYHVYRRSQSIKNIQSMLEKQPVDLNFVTDPNFATDPMIRSFIDDLIPLPTNEATHHGEASDSVVEIHADTLRAPIDLGWFLVDLAIRLGLLGTIIGFILIFTSLSNISLDGAEGLGALLVAMSGGMGTALLTTLSGLVGASFLSVQYLILGRQAEYQIALLIRLRNRLMHSQRI